jgi:hypothetical protein
VVVGVDRPAGAVTGVVLVEDDVVGLAEVPAGTVR